VSTTILFLQPIFIWIHSGDSVIQSNFLTLRISALTSSMGWVSDGIWYVNCRHGHYLRLVSKKCRRCVHCLSRLSKWIQKICIPYRSVDSIHNS
jgi:hypothetical protein